MIAKKFRKWMEKDDYPKKLLNRIETRPEYSILDIGCGEGVVTIPLAKKVSNVTAIDLSSEMLELLKEKAQKEGLDNINYIHGDITSINPETVGKHDVIIASRALNGIRDIGTLLKKINGIGKYVYITLKSPEIQRYDVINDIIFDKRQSSSSNHIYIYNMLYQMGIIANMVKLECKTINTYNNIEEAVDRYKWKIGEINPKKEKILRNNLENILIKKEDGTLENPCEKPDWILVWWKND